MLKTNVGDFVYESFKPQNPGFVTKLLGEGDYTIDCGGFVRHVHSKQMAEVRFLHGGKKTVDTQILRNFNTLIEDHKTKLATHQKALEEIKKERESEGL
jgi:hypothetical protein